MDAPTPIPYEDFGGQGAPLHFGHANGYPPAAYAPLFGRLTDRFHVVAMRMRPLWPNQDPHTLSDWRPLSADLSRFMDERGLYGVDGAGHSMGATISLRLALSEPDRFRALALVDPVFFPPRMILFWNLVYSLGLGYRLHPLVKGALKRRTRFASRAAMLENYRQKRVFRRMSDASLAAYVDSLACPRADGSLTLCYPAGWEARIYVTGARADLELWRRLASLKPPLLIVRGAQTDTFWEESARLVRRRLPSAEILTLPDATHLVPLEKPAQVAEAMSDFFDGSAIGLL